MKSFIFSQQFYGSVAMRIVVGWFGRFGEKMLASLKSSDFFQNMGKPSHQLTWCH